ncbi:MAG: leucyl aminopeptidase family protein, partial [Proteobacteria bacterium]|nr:leucyl aminopeptidase family protein [Pseudomonadota bacterium]
MPYYTDEDTAVAGFTSTDEDATSLTLVTTEDLQQRLDKASDADKAWIARQSFNAKPGEVAFLANGDALIGWDGDDNLSSLGHLPMRLPEGNYQLS